MDMFGSPSRTHSFKQLIVFINPNNELHRLLGCQYFSALRHPIMEYLGFLFAKRLQLC